MVRPLMEKNLKDFDKYFYIALKKSKIIMDYNMFTIADLKQDCYIVYDRMQESTNDESYPYYVIGRLVGAILDYHRKIFKTRNYPNNTHNVSIEELVFSDTGKNGENYKWTFGETLEDINSKRNLQAEDIATEVMNDPEFNWKEKEFFDLYFIQDINSPQIAKIWGVSEPMVSTYKTKVEKKLRRKYGKES